VLRFVWRQVLALERTPLIALATAKILIFSFGLAAALLIGAPRVGSPHDVLEIWRHWDVYYYLAIAERGYVGTDERITAFFPLFPLAIAAATVVMRDYLVGGFLTATVASITAVVALHRLVRRDEAAGVSTAAVIFLLVFPTSFFLHIPYSEGLFLSLALLSFLTARDGRWLPASAFAALAAFTRANGALLLPALAVEAYAAFRLDRKVRAAWAWLALVPAGTVGYLAVNQLAVGDPFRFVAVLRIYWERTLDWPWTGVMRAWVGATEPSPAQVIWIGELLFIAISIAASAAAALFLRPSYATWTAANTLLFISTGTPLSVPRYALLLFPMFILLGRLSSHGRWPLVVLIPSIALLCFLVGRFVLGQWAF
jgi:Gpi18-like mannosyltransferase